MQGWTIDSSPEAVFRSIKAISLPAAALIEEFETCPQTGCMHLSMMGHAEDVFVLIS